MKLSEFVRQSLVQIIEGVSAAQFEAEQHRASVNPMFGTYGVATARNETKDEERVQLVEFEVQLSASDTTGGEGGIRVFAARVGGRTNSSEESSGRVRFDVPITLPKAK